MYQFDNSGTLVTWKSNPFGLARMVVIPGDNPYKKSYNQYYEFEWGRQVIGSANSMGPNKKRDVWISGGKEYNVEQRYSARVNITHRGHSDEVHVLRKSLRWERGPDLPIPLAYHCQLHNIADDSIVVFGGFTSPQKSSNDLWQFKNSTWQLVRYSLQFSCNENVFLGIQ